MIIRYDSRVHACYEPIKQAATESRDWVFLAVPAPEIWIGRRKLLFPGLRQFLHLITHFVLAVQLIKHARSKFVFVREFITLPLFAFLPLWWPLRARIIFLNHHNFQFAYQRWHHRIALKLLILVGTRIAAEELSLRRLIGVQCTEHDIVVPFPVAAEIREYRTYAFERKPRLKIGVLTSFRAEQRAETLINHLSEIASTHSWDLAVASHYHTQLANMRHKVTEIVPLNSDTDYWDALRQFDVIVFYYDRQAYEYRASGIIADAIACGVPVICPNYPVLTHQVSWPARIGLVYEELAELPGLIEQISGWASKDIEAASRAHYECRGQRAYVQILDALRNGAEGDLCQLNSI